MRSCGGIAPSSTILLALLSLCFLHGVTSDGITLYASEVIAFSSEWSQDKWSANKILGAPDVYPNFASNPNNWSPLSATTRDLIEVKFAEKIDVRTVITYVSRSTEHITNISIYDSKKDSYITIYESPASAGLSSGSYFAINLDDPINSDQVRVESDSNYDTKRLEIDAISISSVIQTVNNDTKGLYASRVRDFSSQWTQYQWSASKILGPPDVYPFFGSNPNNWTPISGAAQNFIEVEFPEKVNIEKIEVYVAVSVEHITKVSVLNGSSFIAVYEATATAGRSSQVLTIDLDLAIYSDVVRIDSDSSNDVNWLEIDAVEISGESTTTMSTISTSYSVAQGTSYSISTSTSHGIRTSTSYSISTSTSTSHSTNVAPATEPSTTTIYMNIVIAASIAVPFTIITVVCIFAVAMVKLLKPRQKRRSRNNQNLSLDNTACTVSITTARPQVEAKKLFELNTIDRQYLLCGEQIKLKEIIGKGQFGNVYHGILTRNGIPQPVAVKTVKNMQNYHIIINESMKMKEFDHLNVIQLIGVCIDMESPYLIMPYMSKGSLLDFLIQQKETLTIKKGSICDETYICSIAKDLLAMCLQVAKGMEYLANKRFIHRDLAARNCLIDESGLIKISDFGLMEDIYLQNYYRQNDNSSIKLPIKWMALESIHKGIFSEKTDVWSFGVVCWEIFTCGDIPYPGMNPREVIELLDNGERLLHPDNAACSTEMYTLMLSCWNENATERPSFQILVHKIDQELLKPIAEYVSVL